MAGCGPRHDAGTGDSTVCDFQSHRVSIDEVLYCKFIELFDKEGLFGALVADAYDAAIALQDAFLAYYRALDDANKWREAIYGGRSFVGDLAVLLFEFNRINRERNQRWKFRLPKIPRRFRLRMVCRIVDAVSRNQPRARACKIRA